MDERRSLGARLLTAVAIVVGLLVAVPLAVAFALAYYVSAVVFGVVHLAAFAFGRKPPEAPPLRRPHFLDVPADVPEPTRDASSLP